MAQISSIYDHFIIWPSSATLTFNLPEQMFQMALLLLKDNNWATLLWNPRTDVEVMAWTSSIYDHFIIWPSTYQSEQTFQMALLLIKENNCAKLFWNPYTNVQVMTWTSSIYDHFTIWPSSVPLTFNVPEKNVSSGTSTPQGEQLCQIILKFMHKCRSYGPDKSGWTQAQHTHRQCMHIHKLKLLQLCLAHHKRTKTVSKAKWMDLIIIYRRSILRRIYRV